MESSAVRPHILDEELNAYCDGELSPPQRVEIAEHLLGCLICRSAHAEVEELRARTTRLLAIAAPMHIRRPVIPAMPQARHRRQLPRMMAAAGIAVIGAGVWFSLQPDQVDSATQFATTLVAPGLLTHGGTISTAVERAHELEIASRDSLPGNVITPPAAPAKAAAVTRAMVDVDPVVASEWQHSNWDDALHAANGSLARVPGVLVTAVRTRASARGARPMFMVRQELGDGRPVWVFEGPVDDFAAVDQLLDASGISTSMAMRTRPDYVTTDSTISRAIRMVTVAGYLPVDSLNALAAKLVLR